jgi:hypothetical protein
MVHPNCTGDQLLADPDVSGIGVCFMKCSYLTCQDPSLALRASPCNTTHYASHYSMLFIYKHRMFNGISTMYDGLYSKCTGQFVRLSSYNRASLSFHHDSSYLLDGGEVHPLPRMASKAHDRFFHRLHLLQLRISGNRDIAFI